jgi:hypothetical protein
MSNVVQLRYEDPEERFRDRLMTARAILRGLIDEESVTEDVLQAVCDLADDMVKAVGEFRRD